jgi:hypothetical protein
VLIGFFCCCAQTDFDQNGFFYMIATKCKSVSWQNPMDSGRIKIVNNGQFGSSPAFRSLTTGSVRAGSTNGSIRSWLETNTPSDNTYFYNGRPNHIIFNCGGVSSPRQRLLR